MELMLVLFSIKCVLLIKISVIIQFTTTAVAAKSDEPEECNYCPEGQVSVQIKDCYNKNPTNGCGSSTWSNLTLEIIDLFTTDEATDCCNEHDLCYEKCGKTFKECQDEFKACLNAFYKGLSVFTALAGCSSYKRTHLNVCSCVEESEKLKVVDVDCPLDHQV
ncbi:uncharacterized protein LOC142344956 [Convolutriloba macropyga]|uniref:uncharacterized protein LOC142344956 n=1 Tax=Convolutriloba macropyga TaxID=536237 RepID=UPI003F523D37